MGKLPRALGALLAAMAGLAGACSAGDPPQAAVVEDPDAEPPRVPDPPPRYAKVHVPDGSAADTDGATSLEIRCGREKPYVCPLDDGTFACSPIPCVPDCTRIGCLGGQVCAPCDGGYRCVDPASGC